MKDHFTSALIFIQIKFRANFNILSVVVVRYLDYSCEVDYHKFISYKSHVIK